MRHEPILSVELKRLQGEHEHAVQKTYSILIRKGMNSLEFLEANEIARNLASRIKRLRDAI